MQTEYFLPETALLHKGFVYQGEPQPIYRIEKGEEGVHYPRPVAVLETGDSVLPFADTKIPTNVLELEAIGYNEGLVYAAVIKADGTLFESAWIHHE